MFRSKRKPAVSLVVVTYDMQRELPRTLRSLSSTYQRDIDPDDYEIIVVDNGSPVPVDAQMLRDMPGHFRLIRIRNAPKSPALALNRGIAAARADIIGIMIDGSRIVTPGLLHFARHGVALKKNAVVATLGYYLGFGYQGWGTINGYTRSREDALLERIEWPTDGYRLFEIATLDESSLDGWFKPIAESNALFANRRLWESLGAVDERFDAPGGGMVNLDTFSRLLDAANGELVILLGEGTFHQLHGGVSTNVPPDVQLERVRGWGAQYTAIRGRMWTWPEPRSRTYVGSLPPAAFARFSRAAVYPAGPPHPLGESFDRATWSLPPRPPVRDGAIAKLVEAGRHRFASGDIDGSYVIARLLYARFPHVSDLEYILPLTVGCVQTGDDSLARSPARYLALGEAYEILGEPETAREHYRSALLLEPDLPAAHLGLSRLRMPGPGYLEVLADLHEMLEPQSVVEIGIYRGSSLVLAKSPATVIGVDPSPTIMTPLRTNTHIFTETSDAFFEKGRIASVLGEKRVAFGFIDGLHTFEQALRDFIGLEAACDPDGVIVFHDTVPLDEPTQSRPQATTFYTGDVWKIVPCLKSYRPDLDIFTIATNPTGLTVVRNLDPNSRILSERFQSAVGDFGSMPYIVDERDLYAELNVVPNDRSAIRGRVLPRS